MQAEDFKSACRIVQSQVAAGRLMVKDHSQCKLREKDLKEQVTAFRGQIAALRPDYLPPRAPPYSGPGDYVYWDCQEYGYAYVDP